MNAFLVSFGIIFAAELGDKSQLMALTFAARYRAWVILAAITAATAVVHLASVAIGAAVGVALNDDNLIGKLLALPVTIAGLLVCVALALLWRSFCELYVAVFRIADDLRALRHASDADHFLKRPLPPTDGL